MEPTPHISVVLENTIKVCRTGEQLYYELLKKGYVVLCHENHGDHLEVCLPKQEMPYESGCEDARTVVLFWWA